MKNNYKIVYFLTAQNKKKECSLLCRNIRIQKDTKDNLVNEDHKKGQCSSAVWRSDLLEKTVNDKLIVFFHCYFNFFILRHSHLNTWSTRKKTSHLIRKKNKSIAVITQSAT